MRRRRGALPRARKNTHELKIARPLGLSTRATALRVKMTFLCNSSFEAVIRTVVAGPKYQRSCPDHARAAIYSASPFFVIELGPSTTPGARLCRPRAPAKYGGVGVNACLLLFGESRATTICENSKYVQGGEVRITSGSSQDAAHPSRDSPNTPRRFALGARDVCLGWVKTRRAPSRHCQHASIYGHTSTAVHETSNILYPFGKQ